MLNFLMQYLFYPFLSVPFCACDNIAPSRLSEDPIFCIVVDNREPIQFKQFNKLMQFNKEQIKDLALGSTAVLVIYLISGVIQQHLIDRSYLNDVTGAQQKFPYKVTIVMAPALMTWLMGFLYNRNLEDRTTIPQAKSAVAGACVFTSTVTYTFAVAKTSFPIIMAVKACSLLSVLLVAIMCTKVKEKNLNLGPKKIITGLVATFGVFLFSYFNPEKNEKSQSSQLIGIVLMFVSLIADGLLPDFQAVIKSEYKPQPTEMMQEINKWVGLFCLAWTIATFEVGGIVTFFLEHQDFTIQIIVFSFLCFVGQIFVYRMIKQFKQHIVPFVVTVRKVLTVILSIIFYNHKTSFLQVIGMIVIFASTFYEFASQVRQEGPKPERFEQVEDLSDFIDTERGELQTDE